MTSTAQGQSDAGGGLLLSRHVAFLAGVLSLDSAASAAGPATHVVASTARLVLDAVLRRLERQRDDDDDVISHSAALHAVDTVARVYDVSDDALCDAVRRFARDVVDNVINDQHLNQVHHCSSTLPRLCRKSRNSIMRINCRKILVGHWVTASGQGYRVFQLEARECRCWATSEI